MSGESLVCWKCGRDLDDVPQPLSRYAECPGCRAELYVCRMCRFFDPAVAQSCREPMAEEVKDKERANFCDFLQPRPGAFSAPTASAGADGAALAALFEDEPEQPASPSRDDSRDALDALFGDAPADKN